MVFAENKWCGQTIVASVCILGFGDVGIVVGVVVFGLRLGFAKAH